MTKVIESKLHKIPIIRTLVRVSQRVKIPVLEGMSLYDLLEIYIIGIVKGALTSRAGAIAFSFFMALFPFMLFMLTLIPFVPIDGFQKDFVELVEKISPPNTFYAINNVIEDIANNKSGGLLSFGFLTSIFLMTNGVNAIFGGFEYSYHIKEVRNIFKQYFIALGVSIILAILVLTTIAVFVYFEVIIHKFEISNWFENDGFWGEFGRIIVFVMLVYISVSILYFFGTKELKNMAFFSPGAVLTTVLTLVMFNLFSVYVLKFSKYNLLYGSIGTLLILMLFVWLNSIILLLGFEIDASLNKLKRRQNRVKN